MIKQFQSRDLLPMRGDGEGISPNVCGREEGDSGSKRKKGSKIK